MLLYIYDAWQKIKDVTAWLTAPARQVVAFVGANPKTALSLWIISLIAAIRYF